MTYKELKCGLPGRVQHENAALAVMACEAAEVGMDPELVKHALSKSTLPGRMQRLTYRGVDVILDGAHNAEAAAYLAEELSDEEREICWVCGFMQGHDAAAFLEPISKLGGELILTWAAGERGQNPQEAAKTVPGGFSKMSVHKVPDDALKAAAKTNRLIVVTGSFYLVGRLLSVVRDG